MQTSISPFTESNYENCILSLLEDMGYTRLYGPDVLRDYRDPLYEAALRAALPVVNPRLPEEALADAVNRIKDLGAGSLLQKNAVFMNYLQNGVPVRYFEKGAERSGLVYLIDYEHPARNTYHAINQWTTVEYSEKRPDVVLFLNGLPLVVIELKSPSRAETDASEAYRQIKNYLQEIPSLFAYNAICAISDLSASKAGTITASEDRFMEWKTKDGKGETKLFADYETFFEGMLDRARLLDILKNFICFSMETEGTAKILAAYHQYFAVKKAVESTRQATQTDGKGGVFWHTQGSGKSLSMVFYTHLLQDALNSPTIVVLTDRNDLDDQLYSQFSKCESFLRQTPVQASCRKLSEEYKDALKKGEKRKIEIGLKDYLLEREANGIIFTTMQKFEEVGEPLSTRRNIIVMADEAHRGQYGLDEKIDPKTGHVQVGTARIIRDSLPNATYIGFTGTPLSEKDRSTREVFGDYIDIYDMTQAVLDGATKPVYYESRVIKLKLNQKALDLIDAEYDRFAENAEQFVIQKSMHEMGRMDAVLGADETIDSLVRDIIEHYEDSRANLLTGKAMIVAYSRPIAMKIYRRILHLRPAWEEKVQVVMTSNNDDPEDWRQIIGNSARKAELAKRFKDNNDPFKIAIVVDMWLTGFDVPSLATMYVYKPMAGHNLMQAIARVNRVFGDKEGGLVVDYVGIAAALKQAMNDYTQRDRSNYGEMDIAKAAYPKFKEKLEVCRSMLHGFHYSRFTEGTDQERAKLISGGVNFLLAREKEKEREAFIKEALLLRQALSLCGSLANREQRFEAAFFESLRTLLVRLMTGGVGGKPYSLNEINARINELLKASVQSSGVVNLFSNVKEALSLFDPNFLAEIAKMKEKNLAIEILRKLIAEQVTVYKRTNLVKSEKFSELIQRTMNAYFNGLLTNEEVIAELLKMADLMAQASAEGEQLGLTSEEAAFYDALTKPEAVKDFYQNDELVAITKELTDMLRKNRTIDWQKKETARAKMRSMVKRLLKNHHYPPEGIDDALSIVISQCEMWTDNID